MKYLISTLAVLSLFACEIPDKKSESAVDLSDTAQQFSGGAADPRRGVLQQPGQRTRGGGAHARNGLRRFRVE